MDAVSSWYTSRTYRGMSSSGAGLPSASMCTSRTDDAGTVSELRSQPDQCGRSADAPRPPHPPNTMMRPSASSDMLAPCRGDGRGPAVRGRIQPHEPGEHSVAVRPCVGRAALRRGTHSCQTPTGRSSPRGRPSRQTPPACPPPRTGHARSARAATRWWSAHTPKSIAPCPAHTCPSAGRLWDCGRQTRTCCARGARTPARVSATAAPRLGSMWDAPCANHGGLMPIAHGGHVARAVRLVPRQRVHVQTMHVVQEAKLA